MGEREKQTNRSNLSAWAGDPHAEGASKVNLVQEAGPCLGSEHMHRASHQTAATHSPQAATEILSANIC